MLRSILAFAVSATFLGLGLGRFAFSPLIPELVKNDWLDVATAQSIGAANLVGYFFGAVLARPALLLICERRLCTLSGILVVIAYAMFLLPIHAGVLWAARFLAGVGGALLMVVATAAASRQLILRGEGRYQPALFLGIGFGALFAAVFLPSLLRYGIETSIIALTAFSAVSLALLLLNNSFLACSRTVSIAAKEGDRAMNPAVILIISAYGCDALGFVMHTVYLPDMLRRIRGYTETQIGISWAFFGIGACFGPVFVIGVRRVRSGLDALWMAFALKAAGVGIVLATASPPIVCLSLFIVGMLTPALVILTSAALASLTPSARYLSIWSTATGLFAMGQMVGGMVIAAISGQGYDVALILSVSVLAIGAVLAFRARYMPVALT